MRPPLVRDWRMHTEPRMTADELEVAVGEMLGRRYVEQVTGVAALSTVPSLLRELKLLVERRAEPSVVVGPGVRTGVPLLVDNPREVGADRVVSTLAAHRLYDTACVVVDFGTSTNIDVVSAKGEFLGGALAPGIEISMEALATRAAALRTVELVAPRSVIGKNTVECLQAGVLYGFAGQVDGLVRRILDELGPGPVTVIGTGGLAPLIVGESETITEHVPDLDLARAAPRLPAQRAHDVGDHGQRERARRGLGPRGKVARIRASEASRSRGSADQAPTSAWRSSRRTRRSWWAPGWRTGGSRTRPNAGSLGLGGGERGADRGQLVAVQRALVAAHPFDGVVVAVPEDDEHAAGPQHAPDLGLGERPVEPVPRRADDDGVHRGGGQRDPLGGAFVRGDGGEVGAELGEHRRVGIHRRDAQAGPPQQRLGDLAGARAEVEHRAAGGRGEGPVERGGRVAGPVAGVRRRHRAEGLRALGHALSLSDTLGPSVGRSAHALSSSRPSEITERPSMSPTGR